MAYGACCVTGVKDVGYLDPRLEDLVVDEPEILEHPDFLATLSPGVADELLALGARRRFPAGATVFLEGDPAHEVFVLLAGEVKVSVGSVDGREVILDVIEPGALLGELAVIDGRPRSATVSALSAVEVLAVAAGTLWASYQILTGR